MTSLTSLPYDRLCTEIVAQTDQLRAAVRDADLTTPVPSCPGWHLGELLRHLGGAQRWTETVVRTRATGPVSDDQVNDVSGADTDPAAVDAWLADGAARLAAVLREAGPDAPVWTVAPGGTPAFWARRMTYEAVVHRWDATAALGAEYVLAPEVAVEGLDEWMEMSALPQAYASEPLRRELAGPGRTLHFHPTDTGAAPLEGAEWLVDLTGDTFVWRHAHEEAAATVRGPLTSLLLLMYDRPSPRGADIEVLGDAALFETWRERCSDWLRR
ncbi:maleylpyruvate isomerase family mycothiol-dependent enzyme [Streptomyces armeniacus]|uniref:maleylpyruvate isomerase family mycothiol-dependent enzyme n=1 Tax=Streptomyces armeniacus TaxID=83291 RepID=UPI001FEB4705|nr:maleylpyruvate isomerase family mycothiol-dependent enzyme [Streptomyces armeniacus]